MFPTRSVIKMLKPINHSVSELLMIYVQEYIFPQMFVTVPVYTAHEMVSVGSVLSVSCD